MQVTVIECGPFANESERKAVQHLKQQLQAASGDGPWILLTNLTFSVNQRAQSDEVDLVAIGPPGVQVIEVKHWTAERVQGDPQGVDHDADLVARKARKIATTLRKACDRVPLVPGVFLLTQEHAKVKRIAGTTRRGITFFSLRDWREALRLTDAAVLTPIDIKRLGQLLAPQAPVALDGSLRRLAGYVNLELQSPKDERFHRVYKGRHAVRRDRVILHLYDLSASDEKDAENLARREFDSLHRLQLFPWAPRILDSFQDAPGFAGEMCFFTLVDPAAPRLVERLDDPAWDLSARLEFARRSAAALAELHAAGGTDTPLLHRNLNPHTILVSHDYSPVFTGFHQMKIPSEISVAHQVDISGIDAQTAAPEVLEHGLAAADCRSDVYSLCASLIQLFRDGDSRAESIAAELRQGMAPNPADRCSLQQLQAMLDRLGGGPPPRPPVPPARYWTEGQIVEFKGSDYRIVSRLGTGGVGTTFKVVQIDRTSGADLGTYVAKTAHDEQVGNRILSSYRLARSHLGRHAGLSTIYEVASSWSDNSFVALMTWIEGTPLSEFTGVLQLLAEELQEESAEHLVVRWLRSTCEALHTLHRNGLIHGDVSPRNFIVSGGDLVLTDFDFVTRVGDPALSPGTVRYASPEAQNGMAASPADDLYALAASMFHVLTDHEPFQHGGAFDKQRGLNWDKLDRPRLSCLAEFFNRATHPEAERRLGSVRDALDCLGAPFPASPSAQSVEAAAPPAAAPAVSLSELRPQRVEWLKSLLQSYPGSRWGNRETRGLDTEFAAETYVETALERALEQGIRQRRVRLVILCGNAGDGKTALLQHLAQRLGLGRHASSQRLLKGRLPDGLAVRMNLDGSAAWNGRSADELLDEFLEPFQHGPPHQDIAHLLAINDGRLLEWIEGYEERHGGSETALTRELTALLQEDAVRQDSYIRFISLNQRSLVGDVRPDQREISTEFLDRLLDHLYGGRDAPSLWRACKTCTASARCEVARAARLFGPEGVAEARPEIARRARDRLYAALQAVHLRGEAHITVRELRAALVYILFGTHYCDDYHAGEDAPPLPYWDRTFQADAPARQGELLRELARFDPALESHPQIDRHLQSRPLVPGPDAAPHYGDLSLPSARRRAYFEWTRQDIEKVANEAAALDLARGQHLDLFRRLPLLDDAERAHVCQRLCQGIARLEDLPPRAFDRENAVPLRVTPRTPTETAFWVEKPLAAFRLEPALPAAAEGIERLHNQALLIYRYRDGREEKLRMGAELFHLLLELSEGYQLGDISTDDTFAHLSIFVQRLVQEDARELFAWNPMRDETVFHLRARITEVENKPKQLLELMPLDDGDNP